VWISSDAFERAVIWWMLEEIIAALIGIAIGIFLGLLTTGNL